MRNLFRPNLHFILCLCFDSAHLFGPFMLACGPSITSINKARGEKCVWMGASCWQDLSGLFIEGLVSCYHWDVAACGNSGENRPLMPLPRGPPSLLFCSSVFSLMELCEVFDSDGRPTYQHPHRRPGEMNTRTLYSPEQATHALRHTCVSQTVSLCIYPSCYRGIRTSQTNNWQSEAHVRGNLTRFKNIFSERLF